MDIPVIGRFIPGVQSDPKPKGGFASAGAVVVTGASTGIGAQIVTDLASRGVRVFAGVRKLADAPSGEGLSGSIEPVLLDVTSVDQVDAALATVSDAVGPEGLRGVVNNAGLGTGGAIEFTDMSEFEWIFQVNVFGAARVTKAFIPLLRGHGDGRLVFTSSMTGHTGVPFMSGYSASKHAVAGFAESMRRELAAFAIKVAVLSPGAVATPIWDKAGADLASLEAGMTEEARALYPTALKAMASFIEDGPSGIKPSVVSDACRHALYADRVQTDYILGQDARLAALGNQLIPAKLMDLAMEKMYF